MTEGFTATAKKGSFNQWDSHSIETVKERISDVSNRLRKALMDDGKHSGNITVHKAIILPLLDELSAIAMSAPDVPYSCSECPLHRHNKDLFVADQTVKRLVRLANSKDSPVTMDEAENLYKLIPKYL